MSDYVTDQQLVANQLAYRDHMDNIVLRALAIQYARFQATIKGTDQATYENENDVWMGFLFGLEDRLYYLWQTWQALARGEIGAVIAD